MTNSIIQPRAPQPPSCYKPRPLQSVRNPMALPREHSYFSTCYNAVLDLQITRVNVYTVENCVASQEGNRRTKTFLGKNPQRDRPYSTCSAPQRPGRPSHLVSDKQEDKHQTATPGFLYSPAIPLPWSHQLSLSVSNTSKN